MGQKVHPNGFRLKNRRNWKSIWFANNLEFGKLLAEDMTIRNYLKKQQACSSASDFVISRKNDRIEVKIRTPRPGQVIGKKGIEIDRLKSALSKLTGKEVWIDVVEIKRPDLDAELLANSVARQLERRVSFRRAMKKAIQASMDSGAKGVKIMVSGRLGGAEIARSECYKEGSTPLHTLRADIDYASVRAETTYGTLGIKVWINLGDETDNMRGSI